MKTAKKLEILRMREIFKNGMNHYVWQKGNGVSWSDMIKDIDSGLYDDEIKTFLKKNM